MNGDGIPDVRVGPYGQMRPDVGQFVHGPQMYPPHYGGMGYGGGARIDVNGDGIPDVLSATSRRSPTASGLTTRMRQPTSVRRHRAS